MARRYPYYNSISKKYLDDARVVTAVISSVDEVKEYSEDKVKTVFKCLSTSGEDKLCIYWGRMWAEPNDLVRLTGKFGENAFIVWQMVVVKKGEQT